MRIDFFTGTLFVALFATYQKEANALPLADPGQILKAVIATDDIFAQADAET